MLHRSLLTGLFLLSFSAAALEAQTKPAHQSSTPAATAPSAPPAGKLLSFADEPLVIEAIGFSMKVPFGATVSTSEAGGITRSTIAPADNAYVLRFETRRTEDPSATPVSAAEAFIKQLLMTDVVNDLKTGALVGSRGLILDRVNDLRIPGQPTPGARFYVSLPRGGANEKTRVIQGYTFFKIAPDQFAVFELVSGEAEFAAARPAYELTVATAKFEDPNALASRRRDTVQAGIAFLTRLTPNDYAAALALTTDDKPSASSKAEPSAKSQTQWYRLYKPASTGVPEEAEERGYRAVRFFRGTRAQIDAKVTGSEPSATNPAGILAEISARLLTGGSTGKPDSYQVIDIQGRYFASDDTNEEAWSVRTAVANPQGKPPSLFSETGTRSGKTMTIVVNMPGRPNQTIRPTVPTDGYLNQATAFLLPRLMLATRFEGELGFYVYQSANASISIRRDSMAREPGTQNAYRLSTTLRESSEAQSYLHLADGELILASLSDGVAMEPVTVKELAALWKRKKLPMGDSASVKR